MTELYEDLTHSGEFITEFGPAINWITAHNPNNHHYHNTRHLLGAAVCADMIYSLWHHEYKKAHPNSEVTPNLGAVAVYAMLAHDYKYAGSRDDSVNIDTTLKALVEDGFYSSLNIGQPLQSQIEWAIRSTEYPYINMGTSSPSEELITNIVRDADQLYSVLYCDESVVRGLFEEWAPRENITDYGTWIIRNVDFVYRKQFSLDASQQLCAEALPNCVKLHFDLYAAYANTKANLKGD